MFKALLEFLSWQNSKQKKLKRVEARFYVIYTLKNKDDATKAQLIEIFHDNCSSCHLSSRTCHQAIKSLLKEGLIRIVNKRGDKRYGICYAIVRTNQSRIDNYANNWSSYCISQLPKSGHIPSIKKQRRSGRGSGR